MPKIKLDELDVQLLECIQINGRISNAELADKVGLSPSPCLRRVKALEDSGVIQRYVGIIDPTKLGMWTNVFLTVRLKTQGRSALEQFESIVSGYEEVMECFLMTGSSDYLIRVLVADMESYEKFLFDKITTIPCVGNIESSFSLKQVIYRTEMPVVATK
ncbi:Lrp/AsnC family transcriptional regulator [Aliiglaciecola sp. SL4]|uniref:Lrp/AsnC family transcriptional regulator n=1 Tax=Aliiglaciecola sp. SL4 TaxID=3239806 RepID=UPI00355C0A93